MALNIKHIADLLQYNFNIPDYQRGYRWEKKHVINLLDDLLDFSEQQAKKEGQFYCLQPLAVIKNKDLSNSEKVVYDVIDGQQRLTTIFLLFSYFDNIRSFIFSGKLATSMYSLCYESRDSDFFTNKDFVNGKDCLKNIDYFYMSKAYNAIKEWFNLPSHDSAKPVILKLLIPEGFKIIDGQDDISGIQQSNDKKNDARFIWYEVESEGQDKIKSIDVFNSLNYGKTALTSTELVKALLLQKDIYGQDEKLNAEKTFRRSCEWDEMEKSLQNEEFWGMLCSNDNSLKNHISLILYYVCKELDTTNKYNVDDESYTFLVCNEFLGNNSKDYAAKVDEFWGKVQDIYTMFHNWYVNRETYHLIGLEILLEEYKKPQALKDRIKLLQNLVKEYQEKNKTEFRQFLIEQIGKKVKIVEKDNNRELELNEVNYHNHPDRLIKILLLFNVDYTMKNMAEKPLFSFHLFRKFNVTSLEHIHPQNLSVNDIGGKELKEWCSIKLSNMKQLQNDGVKFRKTYDEIQKLFEDLNACVDSSDKIIDGSRAVDIVQEIDEEFGELAKMSDSDMHTLGNMALVDKDTNASISNGLLDKKRNILVKRSLDNQTYLLQGTKDVFCKVFTEDVQLPKLWTKPDRDAYFAEIEKVYNEYTK